MKQRREIICDRCGERAKVTRLKVADPEYRIDYEFEVDCRCEGLISWFHGAEPPEFEDDRQGNLFV